MWLYFSLLKQKLLEGSIEFARNCDCHSNIAEDFKSSVRAKQKLIFLVQAGLDSRISVTNIPASPASPMNKRSQEGHDDFRLSPSGHKYLFSGCTFLFEDKKVFIEGSIKFAINCRCYNNIAKILRRRWDSTVISFTS